MPISFAPPLALRSTPPPTFGFLHPLNTGIVRVNYEGQTNFQYIIRASTNLPTWFNLATNMATNAATSFVTDNAATNSPQRFYSAAALKSPMFYYGTTAGSEAGTFILFVRTNNVGTLFALNNTRNIGERVQSMQFDANGNYSGPLYSHASCSLSLSNNILAGRYTTPPASPAPSLAPTVTTMVSSAVPRGFFLFSGRLLPRHHRPGPSLRGWFPRLLRHGRDRHLHGCLGRPG